MLKRFKITKPEDEFQDLGFGNKASNQGKRLVNQDGSFNVVRRGMPISQSLSFYHWLLEMSWFKFNSIVVLAYVLINLFFASLYELIGVGHLGGIIGRTGFDKFMDAFFFSVQTFTTVGYGRISPIGIEAGSIATIESLFGLMGFALATGLLYGRFSRPNAKIIYSKKAIFANYREITGFMFRIANARKNQLIEVEIQVVLSIQEVNNGVVKRRFHDLTLERKKVNFFPLTWTIVHPITQDSPLNGVSYQDLLDGDAEFLILLKAFDDTFSQTVHSRTSYKSNEIEWGAKFSNIFVDSDNDETIADMGKIHDFEKMELNQTTNSD